MMHEEKMKEKHKKEQEEIRERIEAVEHKEAEKCDADRERK